MPNRREQLAGRRAEVGRSSTPLKIETSHLSPVEAGAGLGVPEDVVAFWVPLADLQESRFQYRYSLDEGAVAALAASIEGQDLYQPITVRPLDSPGQSGRYEVVLGHRRLAAFRRLGRPTIPAIIREYDDAQALRAMLDENLRREDVNLFEQTEGVVRLVALASGREGEPQGVTRQLLSEMRSLRHAGEDQTWGEPHATAARLIQEVTGMEWLSFNANRMRVYSLPPALLGAVRAGMPYSLALAVQRLDPGRREAALAFVGGRAGPWKSREELRAWAAAEAPESGGRGFAGRLHALGRNLDERSLNPAELRRAEKLLLELGSLLE